jgi:hypothetical protein
MTLRQKPSRPCRQEILEVAQDFRATCSIAPSNTGPKTPNLRQRRLNRLKSPCVLAATRSRRGRPIGRLAAGNSQLLRFSPCLKIRTPSEKRFGKSRIFLEENTLFEFHFFTSFSLDDRCRV